MRIKSAEGLKIRKMGGSYMIVGLCDSLVNMTDVYTLNESAAYLMERCLEAGDFTLADLSGWLADAWHLDPAVASADAYATVDTWRQLGLLID